MKPFFPLVRSKWNHYYVSAPLGERRGSSGGDNISPASPTEFSFEGDDHPHPGINLKWNHYYPARAIVLAKLIGGAFG